MDAAFDDRAQAARAHWNELWTRLAPDERKAAARGYVLKADDAPMAREAVSAVLAREYRSRVETVERWPAASRGDRLSRVARLDPPLIAAIVARHLVDAHRPMVSRFLDLAGVAHSGGEIEAAAAAGEPIDAERLLVAVRAITAEFDARSATLFLDALDGQRVPRLARLTQARLQHAASANPGTDRSSASASRANRR